MILKDRIGNTLRQGQYVEITLGPNGIVKLFGHVLNVKGGELLTPGGKKLGKPTVTLAFDLYVDPPADSPESYFLSGLLAVVNPDSEALVSRIAGAAN